MQLPDRIEREVLIDVPVERVWALITEPEHLGKWFGDAGAEVDLRPGGELSLSWEDYGTVRGRVEQVEPQRLFSYRWRLLDRTPDGEPGEGNSTLVEFTLAAEGEGTRLRVIESGFADLTRPEEKFEDNSKGWGMELGELADYAQRVAA
jgi:uncharacterized protein YndB with AHSA1/START domain